MTFKLTILGSNSALPTSTRFSTAQVLNVHERFFLIDCAEGTQIQLRRNHIRLGKINHIFISHLHGDHYFGLFGLLTTFSLLKRKPDLHIYAHTDLEKILAFFYDYIGKIEFKIHIHPLNFNQPETLYEDKHLSIESFPLNHRTPTCGFLFTEKPHERKFLKEKKEQFDIPVKCIPDIKQGADFITENGMVIPNQKLTLPPYQQRAYAFCSDTAYDERIIPIIKNVNLLYHEATFMEDKKDRAKETHHSTAKQAATIAQKAQVKKLLIGHFSGRYRKTDKILEEAKTIFENTEAVNDGDSFEVEKQRK